MNTITDANRQDASRSVQPFLYTKRQAAEMLSVSIRSLEKAMAGKRVAFIRLTKRAVRFRHSDLEAYLTRHRVRSVAD